MQLYPERYSNSDSFRKSSEEPEQRVKSKPSDEGASSGHMTPIVSAPLIDASENSPIRHNKKTKYLEALKEYRSKKEKRVHQVLVCVVKSDSVLRPYKPVFLFSRNSGMDSPLIGLGGCL